MKVNLETDPKGCPMAHFFHLSTLFMTTIRPLLLPDISRSIGSVVQQETEAHLEDRKIRERGECRSKKELRKDGPCFGQL